MVKSNPPAAPRSALMTLLDELSAEKHIIYLYSPAGYGKSFSAKMWAEHSGGLSAWVTVSESTGQRPAEFCERFIYALLSLQPDNAALRDIVTHEHFSTAPFEFMERAILLYRSYPTYRLNAIFIVDDMHLIQNEALLKRIPTMLAQAPQDMTILLLSRAQPPDSFSKLIIRDAMAIVDVAPLRLSAHEIRELFASRGRKITTQEAVEIEAETDGWAIGLNALLLADNARPATYNQRLLQLFIRDEIWERWDEARRNFMLRISIEDELTPAFCDAITGRTDSADMLRALVRENAFIIVDRENVYRFHHLFREFLRLTLEDEDQQLRMELYQRAGDWFYSRADYYKAIEYYVKCANRPCISASMADLAVHSTIYSIEEKLAIFHMVDVEAMLSEYPSLLGWQIWAAFVEGRSADLEAYLDRYYQMLPAVSAEAPAGAQTVLMLHTIDYRNSLVDVSKNYRMWVSGKSSRDSAYTFSIHIPLYHRSSRDCSEYMFNTEQNLALHKEMLHGMSIGGNAEVDALIHCLHAGMEYERGNLGAAYEYALATCAEVRDSYAHELAFFSLMMLAHVLEAQNDREGAHKVLERITGMIEVRKAYYLYHNFRAYLYRLRMTEGEVEPAQSWLKEYAEMNHRTLHFYKLYRHFTTARALIVTGDYDMAILLLKKLYALCESYRRPLDMIDADILTAIAYWKKGASAQNLAFRVLERAVQSAQEYGYTQSFANEGAELSNIVHKLLMRIRQKDYTGSISVTEVSRLYAIVLARAQHSVGLTGGRSTKDLRFTDLQKTVISHLYEGLTNREISEKMGLKPSTIKTHTMLIYKKLDVSNKVEAMIKIRELGIMS